MHFPQALLFASSGILGLSVSGFLIQLVTFLIMLWVLKKWAFGPILKVLQNRRELIEKGVKLGQDMERARAELDDQISKKLQGAREEADKIVSLSQQEANKLLREAEESAHKRADSIVARADQQIKQDTLLARKRLEKDLVGLISDATEVIIGEKVDSKKDAALIDKALKSRRTA